MAKALAYGRKRWDALTRYIDDGIAEIDNNIAERAIGRKTGCSPDQRPAANASPPSTRSSRR